MGTINVEIWQEEANWPPIEELKQLASRFISQWNWKTATTESWVLAETTSWVFLGARRAKEERDVIDCFIGPKMWVYEQIGAKTEEQLREEEIRQEREERERRREERRKIKPSQYQMVWADPNELDEWNLCEECTQEFRENIEAAIREKYVNAWIEWLAPCLESSHFAAVHYESPCRRIPSRWYEQCCPDPCDDCPCSY